MIRDLLSPVKARLRRFLSFDGRSNRRQFWLRGQLTVLVGLVILMALVALVAVPLAPADPEAPPDPALLFPLTVFAVGVVFPVFAVLFWGCVAAHARRLHDLGHSAWWLLGGLIPYIGALLLFLYCGIRPGQAGENRFGPAP